MEYDDDYTPDMVVCNKCKKGHFEVDREYVRTEVARYNDFYYSLDEEQRVKYSGPSKESRYESCNRCGNDYKDFRHAIKGEIRAGTTIGPILKRTC